MLIPNIGETTRVCLQSWMGTFICAEGGGGSEVNVTRPIATKWETFEMHRLDATHVTFRTSNELHFLCAENATIGNIINATRTVARQWETFEIFMHPNGGISLKTYHGLFWTVEPHGNLTAHRSYAQEREIFRIIEPEYANTMNQVRIEINVYKISVAPFWHTRTVIADQEYYFDQATNSVQEVHLPNTTMELYRTMVRFVPGKVSSVTYILESRKKHWNSQRREVTYNDANLFTNDLLGSLGVLGIDQKHSGIPNAIHLIPDRLTIQEKWSVNDKRLDEGFMVNLRRTQPHSFKMTLSNAFKAKFQVGCAIGGNGNITPSDLNSAELQLLCEQFNVLTPENCMKSEIIHPQPEIYNWEAPDAFVAFAERHDMSMIGHCLCWHSQSPDWLFREGIGYTAALQQLKDHICKIVRRYKGRVKGWDVVNEAIADDNKDGTEPFYLRDTPALRTIGDGYIESAFNFANYADPGAELYYNDYGIEQPAKLKRTLKLLGSLTGGEQRQGRRVVIHGVGIQGHWRLDRVPFEDIRIAIRAYRELGLKVMITELDISIIDVWNPAPANSNPYPPGCPEEILRSQAEQYAALFQIFIEEKVERVTFWGLHDGHSWLNDWQKGPLKDQHQRTTNYPLLFDRACKPKHAFYTVFDVARRLLGV